MPEPSEPAEYLRLNRANWDDRAVAHAEHGGYDLRLPVEDPTHLSDVVTFDRPRLGDLTGLRGVHLQCHLGTDTLSLSRLGAAMTGLDLSEKSVHYARRLAAALSLRNCAAIPAPCEHASTLDEALADSFLLADGAWGEIQGRRRAEHRAVSR